MNIIGIDVGLATTGWSILNVLTNINNPQLIQYGIIETKSKLNIEDRLAKIFNDMNELIDEYKPEEMAIESLFFFKNQKTVMNVSQVRGVLILASRLKNIDIYNYTPLQVKTAVSGYGRADKKQVQKMIKLIFKLKEIPEPDDAADAIAIALCHVNTKLKN